MNSNSGKSSEPVSLIRVSMLAMLCGLVLQATSCGHIIFAILAGGPYTNGSLFLSLALFAIIFLLSWFAADVHIQGLKQLPGYWPLNIVVCLISLLSVYPLLSDFYYEERFLALDLLILASGLASVFSLYSPRFLILQLWLVRVVIGAFQNAPIFLWDVTDMLHYFNTLIVLIAALCSLHVQDKLTAIFPRRIGMSSAAAEFLIVLGFALTINYFYAGLLKVRAESSSLWLLDGLSYPLSQRLIYFYSDFYHSGSEFLSTLMSREQIQFVLANALFSFVSFATILIAELLLMLFLFNRFLALLALVPLQLFHILSFPMAGVYFSYWFLINMVFAIELFKKRSHRIHELSNIKKVCLTLGAVLLAPITFMTAGLGWVNNSQDAIVWSWHVVLDDFVDVGPKRVADLKIHGESGQVYLPLNPNIFYPYEKSMGMSWRFQRYFEESRWGLDQVQGFHELTCLGSVPDANYECGSILNELSCDSSQSCVKQDFLLPDQKSKSIIVKLVRWYVERLAGDRSYRNLASVELLQTELDRFLQSYMSSIGNTNLPRYYSHMYYSDSHFVELSAIIQSEFARNGLRFSLIKHFIKYVGPLKYVRASEVYYISPLMRTFW